MQVLDNYVNIIDSFCLHQCNSTGERNDSENLEFAIISLSMCSAHLSVTATSVVNSVEAVGRYNMYVRLCTRAAERIEFVVSR